MKALIAAIRDFAQDERGVTAIEYGLIAAAMAAALTLVMGTLGTGLQTVFNTIVAALN
jgi:pilus assembly protein Flp/PilA